MGNIFGAETGILANVGNRTVEDAQQFVSNTDRVFQTVNELITKGYISETSKKIAESIRAKQIDLKRIAKNIENHGNFFINTSRKVSNTESDISMETKKYQD